MAKKFGFSFSAKRALGISAAKGKISRSIGIPLTKQGRQKKLKATLIGNPSKSGCSGCSFVFILFVLTTIVSLTLI